MLKQKTEQIKLLCKEVKTNFLKVGEVLIEIRDKELWNEKYKSFTAYLTSQDFEFDKRYAFRLMDVYRDFGSVERFHQLGIKKLIQLTYVPDKETRKDIADKAIKEDLSAKQVKQEVKKVKEENLFRQIKRKAQREDEDIVVKTDDASAKCKRQAENILTDIDQLNRPMSDMETRINNWLEFSNKFKDKDIETFKAAIFLEWKKIRRV